MLLRLAAGLLVAATSVHAAHNITVSVNATSITYSGTDSWKPYTNCQGTKYTFDTGQYFALNFVGTGVYVVGTASPSGGTLSFNVDGFTGMFDRYHAPEYQCGVLFFGKGGLEYGYHTLTAIFTGPSPENSTASPYFEYQYIMYTQVDPTDFTTSSLVPTSTAISSTTTSPAPTQPASSKINAGAIGGGIAAGAAGLLIIGFIIGFCLRRGKQEKATSIPQRKDLETPRQSLIDSSIGPAGFGRLSPSGDQRRSIGPAHGETTTTPWRPDAEMASILAPQPDSPVIQYPFSAAAPFVVRSSSPPSRTSPVQTYSTGIPYGSTPDYTVGNPTPGTEASSMGIVQLPDSDVEGIATGVGGMMNQPRLPPRARPPEGGIPPPMQAIQEAYNKPSAYE